MLQNLCTCGSPLLARYDLAAVTVTPDVIAARPRGLWRWAELLPVRDRARRVTLGEGDTPLIPLGDGILVKDEGLNPTGSFKARGAAVGASRARELGATHVGLPTNGNAGAAWSAYGRRAGLGVTVAVPAGAPAVTRSEALATGAATHVVDGLIGDAGAMIGRAARREGWFDVSTLKEPYRVEGKKTMGLEIAEQLGRRAPEVVVYPTGGGVGLIGIAKAFAELRELGWLTGPPTRFVAAQSSGCAPVVAAFDAGAETTAAWPDPHTVAYGITVAAPLGGPQLLRILRGSGGTAVAVEDADALATRARCAAEDGLLLSPEGAVALHAVRTLLAAGWAGPDERVVVLNTGSALIQPETLPAPAGLLSPTAELP
jgi:threonine synthase